MTRTVNIGIPTLSTITKLHTSVRIVTGKAGIANVEINQQSTSVMLYRNMYVTQMAEIVRQGLTQHLVLRIKLINTSKKFKRHPVLSNLA